MKIFSLFFFLLFFPLICQAETVRITSNPSGASVEINGVVTCTTPCEIKTPGGLKRPNTAFSSHLDHPLICRISLKGYVPKEIEMTTGPQEWRNLYGTVLYNYWLLKDKLFHVELEKASEAFTGKLQAAEESPVASRAELSTESVVRAPSSSIVRLVTLDSGGTQVFFYATAVCFMTQHIPLGFS